MIRVLFARVFPARGGAGRPVRSAPRPEVGDGTLIVPPSQAVTVAGMAPGRASADPRARRPLSWPARDASRYQRLDTDGEAAPSAPPQGVVSPSAVADDATAVVPVASPQPPDPDVTVVVQPAGDLNRSADPDVTVVRRPADQTFRRP